MPVVDFMERTALATLKVVADSYDAAYERVIKLAALILGGGGAAGIYALGKIGNRSDLIHVLPLSLVAVWWMYVGASLMHAGSKSRTVNLGASPMELRKIYNEEIQRSLSETDPETRALEQTRWRHLDVVEKQIDIYVEGLSSRSEAIDKASKKLFFSPLLAVIGLVVAAAVDL
jgi:hypothetical protein